MGCISKDTKLYKDIIRIYGEDYSTDAYAMAFNLDDFMKMKLITKDTLSISNDKQIVYTVPKEYNPYTKESKKQPHIKGKLLKEIRERGLDTIEVKEIGKSTAVFVRPDRVLTDKEHEAEKDKIKAASQAFPQAAPLFEEDYEISEEALKEQYVTEDKEIKIARPAVQKENQKELNKVGIQLKLFNDDLSPEQSEIYLNFEKYYPSMSYLSDSERQDFVKLLSKGAIETKCKL